jgi:glycosyl hydrolase family 42 (putative beta-galactosidase)
MPRRLSPAAALFGGLLVCAGAFPAGTVPPSHLTTDPDPYFAYVTHAREFQPVRTRLRDRWDTWLYLPWRYRWTIGTGDAGGRFCRDYGIRGGVNDYGRGPLDWFERWQLRFYLEHTAGKGDLHLLEGDFTRLARDPRALRPRPLDGALLGALKGKVAQTIAAVRGSPLRLAYALDDETSWGSFVRPLPWRVNDDDAAYGRWLAAYYGGGSPAAPRAPTPRFVTYDDVRGELDGPLSAIDLSPLLDRMTYNDSVWANFLGDLVASANRLDPAVPSGIVGAQSPSLWGGYDYAKLLKKVELVEPYDRGSAPEIVRSLAPADHPWVLTHFHDDRLGPLEDTWFAWHWFAHGARGLVGWVDGWFEGGRPRPWLDRLKPTLKELGGAQSRKLVGARRLDDGIGLYYSHPSIQVSWCLDAEPHGATWPNRNDDDRLGTSHLVRKAWETLLADAGLGYRFVAYDEVVARGVPSDLRVLILPACYALSDVEARRIGEFAAEGGTVIADFACGLFDPHGRGRSRGALDDLFGVRHDGSETRRDFFSGRLWVETDQEAGYRYRRFQELFATLPTPLREGYAVAERRLPAGTVRRVGRGRAVYLNLSPQRYLADRQEGTAGAAERRPFLQPILEAGVAPWIAVRDGSRAADLETVAWWKDGRTYVLTLSAHLTDRRPPAVWGPARERPVPLDVELAGVVHSARDERTGRWLPSGRRFHFTLEPAEAVFWSFAGRPPSQSSGSRSSYSRPSATARTLSARGNVCSPACTTSRRSSRNSFTAIWIEGVRRGAAVRLTSKPSLRRPRTTRRSSSAPAWVAQKKDSSGRAPSRTRISRRAKPSQEAPTLG